LGICQASRAGPAERPAGEEEDSMTYEKAVDVLVEAGLLEEADGPAAVKALDSPTIDMTYPAWAEALVRAGLLDKANKQKAEQLMEKTGRAEAEENPEEFDEGLEGAGIL